MQVKDALVDLYNTWGCDESEDSGGLLSKSVARVWKALDFARQPDEANFIAEFYHTMTLAGACTYVSRSVYVTVAYDVMCLSRSRTP